MQPITGAYVLAADTVLIPLDDMDDEERVRLGGTTGDVVLTRLTGRARSKLVDPQTARLVAHFRAPNSIVASIIADSQSTGADPETTLERAYPVFQQLIGSGFLVPEDAPEARRIEPELAPGSTWRGIEVIGVVQSLEDVDVYRARSVDGPVALKRARADAADAAATLAHEAEVLRLLAGRGAPRLVAEFACPAALAVEWCDGVDADRAAGRLRALPPTESRRGLLDLCRSVAAAYAAAHQRGVVHGDVHPRNVVVDPDGTARLIDFGLASTPDSAPVRRAGAGYFFEPEYARARLAGDPHLPASPRGELHVVGHLLYRLVTGHGYRDFPADEKGAMRALADGGPEPFEHWGLAPWDSLERVLARALACDAEKRFADMTDFAAALDGVDIPAVPETSRRQELSGVEAALAQFDPDGRLFAEPLPSAPRCSITFGSAGIALFLLRMAAARDSARLLGWSKLWIEKSAADADRCGDDAFYLPAAGLRPEVVGTSSVQHTGAGLHVVRAMVARAMGDVVTERKSANAFARVATEPVAHQDIAFGRAGMLLTWALLREGVTDSPAPQDPGAALAAGLSTDLASTPALTEAADFPFAGMAHGWAGLLHALLAWSEVSGAEVSGLALDRLDELAALAEPVGAGARWPIHLAGGTRGAAHMRGWCNGSAGMVLLFTQAATTLDAPRYLEVAERAGVDACSAPDDAGYLCCGDAGQAYAALALHRATRDERWLTFARRVADRYAGPRRSDERFSHSLLKGPLGGLLLAAELEAAPDEARMPLFELAGWAR